MTLPDGTELAGRMKTESQTSAAATSIHLPRTVQEPVPLQVVLPGRRLSQAVTISTNSLG